MKRSGTVLIIAVVVALVATPVYPVAKEIIQIQTALGRLEADLRDMRSSLDERMGMMRQIMDQSATSVNKLNLAIESVQRSIQGTVAAQGTKVDAMATNVQGIHDQLEDVKARLAKLSDQMAQMRAAVETLQTPPQPAQPAAPAPAGPPASPEVLYQSALKDLNGGRPDAALQQFQEYLKFYPETDLAGNAQFYIGEALARLGRLEEAVQAYDMTLERYPRGNKAAAAHLKKGFVLLEMRNPDAGERELRELLRRFPNSDEAKLARERLRLLGPGAPARPGARKPR